MIKCLKLFDRHIAVVVSPGLALQSGIPVAASKIVTFLLVQLDTTTLAIESS